MAIGYGRVRVQLEAAFQLCDSLGLDARRSRFGEHSRRLDHLIAIVNDRQLGRPTGSVEAILAKDQIAYLLALTESVEFGDIMGTLTDSDPLGLRAKLEVVLTGPPLPIDEDTSSGNKSRNALFELSLAAHLKRAGYEPELGEHPDLRITVDGGVIGVECKRPFTESGVTRNLTRAEKQIIQKLKDPAKLPPGARGIVAISLSKTINPGDLQTQSSIGRKGMGPG